VAGPDVRLPGAGLAGHIPGARLLELPGVDHDPWVGNSEQVLNAVEGVLAERRAEAGQAGLVARNR
jgi:pimeloyl-ACP methyl ester carboxylesterase